MDVTVHAKLANYFLLDFWESWIKLVWAEGFSRFRETAFALELDIGLSRSVIARIILRSARLICVLEHWGRGAFLFIYEATLASKRVV
jgi:hypothetical protein